MATGSGTKGDPWVQFKVQYYIFALVFVIFFAVFYGLVSYALPFVLMQTFNQATAEAIRRAGAVDATIPNYSTVVVSTANAALSQQLSSTLPSLNVVVGTDTSTVYDPTAGTLTVSVNYPVSKLNQVIPFLVLPGIGAVRRPASAWPSPACDSVSSSLATTGSELGVRSTFASWSRIVSTSRRRSSRRPRQSADRWPRPRARSCRSPVGPRAGCVRGVRGRVRLPGQRRP